MHAGLPYVCPMNLVSIFDRSRCCIVRVCGVARGSHVGYILNLLRCRELRLFTADWKDVTTGLLFACIGFFVVLGYRLQNIRSPCWKGAMCAVHGISQRCQDHGHFILLVVQNAKHHLLAKLVVSFITQIGADNQRWALTVWSYCEHRS